MKKLRYIICLACLLSFLVTGSAGAEPGNVAVAHINEAYFQIGGKPWTEADRKADIVLGIAYLGNYGQPQAMALPKGLDMKELQRVYAGGQEAYLLVPKFSGTGLVVSKVEQFKIGKKQHQQVTDIFVETIDDPVLIFCNSPEQPYDVQVTVTRSGVATPTKFFLHLNRIRLLPMVPRGVRDFTAYVKTNFPI